jgi:hypothetical protein
MKKIEEKIKDLLKHKWIPVEVDSFDGINLYNFKDPIKGDDIPLENAWARHAARIKRNPAIYNKVK